MKELVSLDQRWAYENKQLDDVTNQLWVTRVGGQIVVKLVNEKLECLK